MYVTVTSSPSVREWAWHNCCHEFREVLIWCRERNSSSTFRKCTRLSLYLSFFNGDLWERLLALVTFCLFFQRVSSLRLFQRRLQLTLNSIYSTYVSLSMTFCGSEYNRNMLWIDVTRNTLLWAPYSSVVSHLRPETWWNKSCLQGFKGYSQ